MPRHDASEFKFAKRAVRKVAERSVVFPEEAGGDDWFLPPDTTRRSSGGDRSCGTVDGETATSAAALRTPESRVRDDAAPPADPPSVSSLDLNRDVSSSASLADETASTASLSSYDQNLSPFQSRAALGGAEGARLIENLSRLDVGGPMPALRRRSPGYIEACHTLRSSGTSCPGGKASAGGTVSGAPSRLAESCAKVQEEIEDEREHSSVPAVHERDVQYGSVLGTGGFCEVRLAQVREGRGGRRRRSSDVGPGTFYAMKYLSPSKTASRCQAAPSSPSGPGDEKAPGRQRNKHFERGIADLAIEARFLSVLRHENIIELHGVSDGSLESLFNCAEDERGLVGRRRSSAAAGYRHRFGYFLLLDPLYETLTTRCERRYLRDVLEPPPSPAPSPSSSSSSSGGRGRRRGDGSERPWFRRLVGGGGKVVGLPGREAPTHGLPIEAWREGLAERLEAVRGVADALRYLHDDCRIVFRDIKPDNIGFYRRSDPTCTCRAKSRDRCRCYTEIPKLFDFGLAKEMKPRYLKRHPAHADDSSVATYKLTARSGSRRYMSPEVALGHPYNETADVYSLGVVLYQVASLVVPFEGYSLIRHEDEVLHGGDRPDVTVPSRRSVASRTRRVTYEEYVDSDDPARMAETLVMRTKVVWPRNLRILIEACWHDDMRGRPDMGSAVELLDSCIEELRGGAAGRRAGGRASARKARGLSQRTGHSTTSEESVS